MTILYKQIPETMNPQENQRQDMAMTQRLQAFLESLQVKLALGKAELQDLWAAEKKELLRYISEQKRQLEASEAGLPASIREIGNQLNQLEAELDQTGDRLERALEDQQPRLRERLKALETSLKASADALGQEVNEEFTAFRGRMEAMHLRQRLEEAGEDLDAFAEKIREKGPQLWKNLQSKEVSGDVSAELGKAWDHIKKAADELFG